MSEYKVTVVSNSKTLGRPTPETKTMRDELVKLLFDQLKSDGEDETKFANSTVGFGKTADGNYVMELIVKRKPEETN